MQTEKRTNKQRPAEKPEIQLPPANAIDPRQAFPSSKTILEQVVALRGELRQARSQLRVDAGILKEFNDIAARLGLPVEVLADNLLAAFNEMAEEDHWIKFPLLLEQVAAPEEV